MKDALAISIPVDLADGTPPIVMVDDEALDFELARRFYNRSGLSNPFVHYSDGKLFIDALEQAKERAEPLPALVLMDINMPRMNGFEVVAAMRGNESFRVIPVVSMLTSSSDPRDREQASRMGADAYLVKPFNPRAYLEFFSALGQL